MTTPEPEALMAYDGELRVFEGGDGRPARRGKWRHRTAGWPPGYLDARDRPLGGASWMCRPNTKSAALDGREHRELPAAWAA